MCKFVKYSQANATHCYGTSTLGWLQIQKYSCHEYLNWTPVTCWYCSHAMRGESEHSTLTKLKRKQPNKTEMTNLKKNLALLHFELLDNLKKPHSSKCWAAEMWLKLILKRNCSWNAIFLFWRRKVYTNYRFSYYLGLVIIYPFWNKN